MQWKLRWCVAAAALLVAAQATALVARPAYGVSVPRSVSLVQGGVATVGITLAGSGFTGGTLRLSSPTSLDLSNAARLYGADASRVGVSFDNVNATGANLTLYVGNQVPTGSYPLTVTATANGVTRTASLVLNVLAHGTVYEVWPSGGASYQSYLTKLKPGDELVLHQGTYSGSALIRLGGTAERPIVIRGYGGQEAKPVLKYTGADSNQWEIHASNVVVQGLEFMSPATDSIRIRPPAAPAARAVGNVSIVADTFVDCGSECLTANDPGTAYSDIRMVDNLVVGTRYTAVYVGNQQGTGAFRNFLFEGNVIDARSIGADDVVGYGVEVKLNVENAELRNNYIVGARGPGIMTYGLKSDRNPAYSSVVEGNIAIGACTDANINIGAGPAVVRQNLTLGGYSGGYAVSAYHDWPLLSAGIQVYANTGVLNAPYGFQVDSQAKGTGMGDLQMYDNLAYPVQGGKGFQGLPAANGSNRIEGNRTAPATTLMVSRVQELRGLIPSPQALRPLWSQLSASPLGATQLTGLLNALVKLPNQSSSNAPRACPTP